MLITTVQVTREAFEAETGWELRPEGACRGDLCVPLPAGAVNGDRVNVQQVADAMGMALVHHDNRLAALGPASFAGRALPGVTAPDLVLPDFDGRAFHLSSLRGQKVVLVAWSPY